MTPDAPPEALPRPPYEPLRDGLLGFAATLRGAGDAACAERLETMIRTWWTEQQAWNDAFSDRMRLYHEINNALVGVRGNAQLLLLGPLGSEPEVRQRLEVMIRESTRIKEAASRLRELREEWPGSGNAARAA
jgi:nitrogen-specific signal transduction histidine kinase